MEKKKKDTRKSKGRRRTQKNKDPTDERISNNSLIGLDEIFTGSMSCAPTFLIYYLIM
jgi:hypothetical protein